MILEAKRPEIAQHLDDILASLKQKSAVDHAVLTTDDGLPVAETGLIAPQLAAIAGFMVAAARQSCATLGYKGCCEVCVQMENGRFLLCHAFYIGQTRLLLALIFNKRAAYKRLLARTTSAIQQAMET